MSLKGPSMIGPSNEAEANHETSGHQVHLLVVGHGWKFAALSTLVMA